MRMTGRGGGEVNEKENRRRIVSGMCGELLSVYQAQTVLCYKVSLVLERENVVL